MLSIKNSKPPAGSGTDTRSNSSIDIPGPRTKQHPCCGPGLGPTKALSNKDFVPPPHSLTLSVGAAAPISAVDVGQSEGLPMDFFCVCASLWIF